MCIRDRNYEATDLFRDLDPATWKDVGQNPVALLERLSYEKLEEMCIRDRYYSAL